MNRFTVPASYAGHSGAMRRRLGIAMVAAAVVAAVSAQAGSSTKTTTAAAKPAAAPARSSAASGPARGLSGGLTNLLGGQRPGQANGQMAFPRPGQAAPSYAGLSPAIYRPGQAQSFPRPGMVGGHAAGVAAMGANVLGPRVIRSTSQRFVYRGRVIPAFRTAAYIYPPGFGPHHFSRGDYVPPALLIPAYVIVDYAVIGLGAPPDGDQWVRVGSDAVLVDEKTDQVQDQASNVFDQTLQMADDAPAPSRSPWVDPSLPAEFASGDFKLGHGPKGGCVTFYQDPGIHAQIDGLWNSQDWNGLAKQVIALGCDTDIAYYILGISAESLGLHEGAKKYYGQAMHLTTLITLNPYRQCLTWGDSCRGVAIAQESAEALARMGQ